MRVKFVTWRNNGIFLPNNEFHSAEQRINNGNRPSTKNVVMAADGPHIGSLTSLPDKPIKAGDEVVSRSGYVTYQMDEVACREMFTGVPLPSVAVM